MGSGRKGVNRCSACPTLPATHHLTGEAPSEVGVKNISGQEVKE